MTSAISKIREDKVIFFQSKKLQHCGKFQTVEEYELLPS